MIELKNLNVTFNNGDSIFKACDDVSFKVSKGEIFGIIGLSGAGKSTLIRCINGLQKPDSGSIKIEDEEIIGKSEKELNKIRKEMSMIFQSFNLFNQKNVYKNISYPLEIAGYSKDEIEKRVDELLSFVDLQSKKNDYPSNLSGGQKQRVAIARALAVNPKILLSDESTSALDPANTKMILDLLKKAVKKFNLTIILITHQMEVCREICDRIAVMENGRIIEENTTEELFINPKHSITKSFIRGNTYEDKNTIDHSGKNQHSKYVVLNFNHNITKKAIVSEVIKLTNVDVSILAGKINRLSENTVGFLEVELIGSENNINKAIEIFQSFGVVVEEKND
ncbi:methionine ABC transporter ATP-binding protein [Helcococcus bovis]|uniref:methionine ABC transporter ATP-binding protein n=1 Tax=Helcococcus bovis TaxID=3153252 RepID=UPI0038BB6DC4